MGDSTNSKLINVTSTFSCYNVLQFLIQLLLLDLIT